MSGGAWTEWRAGRVPNFVLRPAQGPGHLSANMNHRWCCRCQRDVPTKGGKVSGGLFTCANCRPRPTPATA